MDPTLRRRSLARSLVARREAAGIPAEQAAHEAGISRASLNRLENAKIAPTVPVVSTLLRIYGATDEEISAVAQIVRDARQRGWWRRYADVLPQWVEMYIGLESGATALHGFCPSLIHGLLQTEGYMHALFTAYGMPPSEVARRTALRLERQRRLRPAMHWVLDEAVLHRPIGDPDEWRAQLRRLIDEAQRDDVTVQVLPFASGPHASLEMPWIRLDFDGDEPPLIYLEIHTSSLYFEEPEELAHYDKVWERLVADALDPEKSLELIAEVADGTQ